MRRAVAILALVSLLAVPLGAWPASDRSCCCDKDCCKSGICPMRRHHEAKTPDTSPLCGEGIHCNCPTEQAQLAPEPPGVLIAAPVMPGLERAESAQTPAARRPTHGFVSPPFEPPRPAA
ncbi:MAG TPA: hypothetical protein VLW54_08065 [Candidatus Acidoferrales bacterium]|nr:hypothetical protein [Candidatus Acidoferrales bacterium]